MPNRSGLLVALLVAATFLSCSLTRAQVPDPAGRQPATGIETATPGGVVRALVVGIDSYRAVSQLDGAVADARDLAGTLQRAGVADVTMMLNENATRAALMDGLDGLAGRASKNDLIIVTFAGHGAQEKTAVSSAEPDGWDEFFVLWGFGTSGPATAERLLDDEIFSWIGRVAATGAQTIFLADVCFGGGLSKAVDPRSTRLAVRGLKRVERPEMTGPNSYYISPGEDRLPRLARIPPSDDATKTYPSLTFLAAVDDRHEAPEVRISGEATPRGAASYVLARALEGRADAEGDRDGLTTRRELIAFVRRHVRMLSGDRQSPVGEPRTPGSGQAGLFRNQASAVAAVPAVPKPGKPASKVAALAAKSPKAWAGAGLLWDARTGDVLNSSGDVMAYGVPQTALPAAVERDHAFQELVQLAAGRSLDMSIAPGDKAFVDGERFEATIEGLYGRHLVLVNLAGDGTLQYLFPEGNADNLIDKEQLTIPLRSEAPFGTDTLIAVATRTRQAALEIDLKLLNAKRSPSALVELLGRHLDHTDRLAIGTYSTRPK